MTPAQSIASQTEGADFNLVYYYLFAGVALMVSAFILLPKVAIG